MGSEVSRRGYIGYLVGGLIVGGVIGAGGGYLAAPPKEVVKTETKTATSTVATTVTAPATTVTKETTKEVTKTEMKTTTVAAPGVEYYGPWKPYPSKPEKSMKWVHWGYRPDIITENIDFFTKMNNENLIQEQVTGEYQSVVETKWLAGEVFDCVYGNAFHAFRWRELGFTKAPEDYLPYMEWIKADMFPSVREAYTHADGKLAGLTYFISAVPAMVAHDDYVPVLPTTWAELYDMCRALKKKAPAGLVKPYVPRFFNAYWGSTWDLQGEVSNIAKDPDLTKTMWDKKFGCLFDATPGDPVYETIKNWRSLVVDNLIEKAVLTAASNAPGEEAYYTGKYAFIATHGLYGYWSIMDPTKSKAAGKATLIPPTAKQNWGVIDTGLYCSPAKPLDEERQKRLVQWLGWKNNKGEFYTAKKWAIEEFLHTAYPAVYEDEEVKASWGKRLGDKLDHTVKASSGYLAGMGRPWIWRSALYGEWMTKAADLMAKALVGDITVEACVKDMRKTSDDLYKKYYK